VLDELERLNREYEARFGFRFVVFVDGRSKSEILDVLRERIGRSAQEELDTGCRELVAIARNRWTRT
jgi:2-oxo-4-hydroxy-4-carboxy--5-ureidoimidazoline (OHCU) decarboxylase